MTTVKNSLNYRAVKTCCLNYDATNDDDVRPKNRPPNKFKPTVFFFYRLILSPKNFLRFSPDMKVILSLKLSRN